MSINALPDTARHTQATKIPAPPLNKPVIPDGHKATEDESPLTQAGKSQRNHVPAWHRDFEPKVRGLRNPWWTLWWLYGVCRLYKLTWLPTPHHWGSYRARISENHAFVWSLGKSVAGVYEEESVTGGVGKTSLSTWHAAELQQFSDANVLLIDADSGAKGKAAIRFEINMDDQLLKFEDVHNLILNGHWVPTHDELYTWLPRHEETGTRLLSTNSSLELTETKMRRVIKSIRPAYSAVFIDTTPGVKEDITRGSRSVATVISVPCLFASTELKHDINTTRDHMNKKEQEFDRRLAEGGLFISVNDVPKGKFNRRTQYELAEQLNVPASQVLLFPSDTHLYKKRPVIRSAVSTRFLYALSESTRLRTIANAEYNKRHPLPLPSPTVKENPEQQAARLVKSLTDLCDSPHVAAALILGGTK